MTQIQLRRDTAANWASVNPVLASGEPAFETDTGKFKIGNGTTAYNSLDYIGAGDLPDNITTQGNTFNGANQLVQLDASGKLPAIDGSQLTNLPGGGSAPANMVTTDTEQTITAKKTITINPTSSNTPALETDGSINIGSLNSNKQASFKVSRNTNDKGPLNALWSLNNQGRAVLSLVGSSNVTIADLSFDDTNVQFITQSGGSKTLATLDDIPSTSNFVDLTSAQTITGNKTFDRSIFFSQNINLSSKSSNYDINLGDSLFPAKSCDITIKNGGLNLIDNNNSGNTLSFATRNTYWRVGGEFRKYINGIDYPYITTNDIGNLKYWTGTEAAYTELGTKDADTLYRLTDTNKVYLGTIQLGGS